MTLTLLAALFLGVLFVVSFRASLRRPALVASLLLLLLLIHELVVRWLTHGLGLPPIQVTLISLWKDVVLAGLLAAAIFNAWRGRRDHEMQLAWRTEDALLFVFGALGVLDAALAPNKLAGVAALRDYLEPAALYVVVRLISFDRRDLGRLLALWMAIGAVMALLAIWQTGWSPEQYAAWGFGTPSEQVGIPMGGVVGSSGLRPPSTVTGPNELAAHVLLLAVAALVLIFSAPAGRRVWLILATILFAVALVVTASRSGFLGLILGLLVAAGFVAARRRGDLARLGRRAWVGAGGVLAALVLFAAVVVFSGMGSRIGRTIAGLAAEYHTQDTLDAVAFLIQHPQGVGMGQVGPRLGFGFPAVAAFHVEGSYFQLAMEFGVWGLAVFLAFLTVALVRTWRRGQTVSDPFLRVFCAASVAGWVGVSVMFLFLPLMQAFPLMAWLWFLMGVGVQADGMQVASGTPGPVNSA